MPLIYNKHLWWAIALIAFSLLCFALNANAQSKDTVYVIGAIQHESLFPTVDVSADRSVPRPKWAKIDHLNNTYFDLSMRYEHQPSSEMGYKGLTLNTRTELMPWPMLGYEPGFAGCGVSHLGITNHFGWGDITVGDVYGQFGSGLILRLYEERSLGVDNALRGAKVDAILYRGVHLTTLGGKQRRYWNCYKDGAWGWNYTQDAVLGANLEWDMYENFRTMQEADAHLLLGVSWVSKYEAADTILAPTSSDGKTYMYNLPEWVGAADVHAQLQMKGWNALVEYAYKVNDPIADNSYSYAPGQTLLMSLSYSRSGMSVMLQAKRSENMAFRSERQRTGTAGMINHLPAFTTQHTYALAALYPYATQLQGEWGFQGEIRYHFDRKTPMGGKYGTTFRLGASHLRGLGEKNNWGMSKDGYYTDVFLDFGKKLTKQWTLNATVMYQDNNLTVVRGHGGHVRSGIFITEAKYAVNKNVQMRAELQYLYTPHDEGQWIFGLYELSLFRHWMIAAQDMYNIGGAPESKRDNYYTVSATWQYKAHRLMAGYTKTRAGYNCSGGVCRYVPKQEGVNITYNYSF